MTFFSQTLPVALAVFLALTVAFFFSRSVLELLFGALRRMGSRRQLDAASE
jgi:hypothetical protein